MKCKFILAAAVSALLMSPAVSLAEQFPMQVTVEAVVPSATGLQISPVGDWAGQVQVMPWNINTQALEPIQQQIDMRSGLGAINAYLTTDAILSSGGDNIGLNVAVAGKPLAVGPASAVEVATTTESAAGKRADVAISAVAPASYVPGVYQGSVFLMFESSAP
jgi:hypothetical protein